MAEDGHAATQGAAAAPGADANHETDKILPPPKMESRKSTWAVSAFDIQASGMATPLGTHSRRSSVDLEDYFVCQLVQLCFQGL